MERTLADIPAMHVSVLEAAGTGDGTGPDAAQTYDVLVTDHVPAEGTPPGARTLLMSPTHVVAPGVDECLPDQLTPEAFVRAVLGAAGRVRPSGDPQPPPPGPGPLSPRERQVLDLIAGGFTHAQTARRLGISRHTVDTHVKRIRSKWGVGNKADMVRLAMAPAVGAAAVQGC
ncbi:helix-turn-helix transcriptional regulator [Streptomyces castrisilvae]|uniref:Helix-turn-helix transcriptional regulator n=1 Tax=Streptomyces castrisilvae TaxID=3033811 RepID=A0ABY9HMX9_9ACTN|nr:helix-turn-helix transcriptional regulator [Streptomyces sp. Mut1]WLQ35489.1 helix-turn-helix transcriptional regulator [Streptomyces sp. Mut1]